MIKIAAKYHLIYACYIEFTRSGGAVLGTCSLLYLLHSKNDDNRSYVKPVRQCHFLLTIAPLDP